jgi:phosphatidylserine decarboxylase
LGIGGCLLVLAGFFWLGAAAVAIAGCLLFFFRDPERKIPSGDDLILSPADGRVVRISEGEGGGEGILVSIFLSLWDVHVNRAPTRGKVSEVVHRKGSFHFAFRDKASEQNEKNTIVLDNGRNRITVKQIAGFIARRVVCWLQPGQLVEAGQRIGMIKFGSRVDLILPEGTRIAVRKGQRVKAGETVIGYVE